MPAEETHIKWMTAAIEEARTASGLGEVPVGAVVVLENTVIGRGHNLRETTSDPTAHAEIIAIRDACSYTGSWRLENADIYVTVEPCPMCAGALVNARISKLVFGCRDSKAGAVRSLYALAEDGRLNHRITVTEGVLADECGRIMSDFFAGLRSRRDQK